MGAIKQGLGIFGGQAFGLDRRLNVFQPLDLFHQPRFELVRQVGQGGLGLGNGLGIERAQAAADLGAQRIGDLDDLGFFGEGHTRIPTENERFGKPKSQVI